jgi:hypothetical protein
LKRLSSASIESSSVREETAQALASGRPVIVVRIEPDRLPAELSSLPIVDFAPGSEATARRALAELLPPPDLRTEENGLSSVAKRIAWSEEIFFESLVEALDHHAQSRAQSLVDTFVRHIEHRPDRYPERHANRDLSVLRKQRQFKLMRRYAEAVLQSGTTNETVQRQYAQSLIEQKAFELALEVLFAIVRDPKSERSEVFEAQGLIGRTYKQRYVDAPNAPESDKLLRRAIDAYESVYREDSTQLSHGINAASCILRGHRDGIEGTDPERARKIAREVLERTSQLEESGTLGIWDYATRVEALLALDSYDAARRSLDAYICHPDMQAFEVSSTYRQFDQLLELGRNDRGLPILNRLWETVEKYRAGGLWRQPFSISDTAESGTRQNVLRPLLIRVTDPEWEPRNVTDLDVQARLGTIISALLRTSLQLDGRAGVCYFERLRFANGEPEILEHRWVRSDLAPGLSANKLTGSFYHYLEEMHGIYMTGERHKIRAQNLSVREAKKFALNEGAAVLVVEGTGFSEVEVPAWYQILYYRGDRYELENEVHAGGGPARLAVRRRA